MSEIIQKITPKWESEETVWGSQTNTNQGGGGFFYSSVLTSDSVVTNLQGKTGKELVQSETLGIDTIRAANSILQNLFVENIESEALEKFSQVVDILDKITVEDKNIASTDAFKNAILFRISFDEVLSLLELPSFASTDIKKVLKIVLGLEKPIPEKPKDDCCECDDEDTPEDEIDEIKEGEPSPPRQGPPPTATGPSGCAAISKATGIPDMKNSLLLCPLPDVKVDAIVSQTYKDWEDKELNENCTIRECASNQNKGDAKFVGSTIGPKKNPSSEPLLPPGELSDDDPDSSRSSGEPGPCGDIDLIQTLPQAYQEILNKYGLRGLIKKAAQCAGIDLPILDLKEVMLMAFIKQLDCNMFLSLIDAVIDMTGIERGPNITEFWKIDKIANLLKSQARTVISALPASQLNLILKTPEINLATNYIGVESSSSTITSTSIKMPQQIEDIVDVIEQWSPQDLVSFFERQNLFDILLYAVCDQDKGDILDQVVEILNQINLDDIGSLSVSLDLDTSFLDIISNLKNIDFSQLSNIFNNICELNFNPGVGAPITWRQLWSIDFSQDIQNIPDIKWSLMGGIDWSKLITPFQTLSTLDTSQIESIDFGVDINFNLLPARNKLSQMADIFTTLQGINFDSRNFDIQQLSGINMSDLDCEEVKTLFRKLGNIDFTDLVSNIADNVSDVTGSLYEKLFKIVKDGLDIDIPDFSLDLMNFDDFQMVPIGELPELPTIDLDLSPTVDLLASVSIGIADTIMEAVSQATLSLLKSTIKTVCESCEQGKVGDLDIGNLIGESSKSSFSPEKMQELKNSVVGGLKDVLPTDVPFTQVTNSLENLIDNVSEILKPGQTGGLLLGESPGNVLGAIQNIINSDSRYTQIAPALQSGVQINRLFSNVGTMVDKVLLTEKISELTKQTLPSNPDKELLVACDPPQEVYERNELRKKGIPEDEIVKQLARTKKRKKKKFAELADLLAQDKLMDGVIPEDDCTLTPSGRKKPSLAPKEPPINDYLLKKTVDVIYDGTYMSFNKEVRSFPDAITVEIESPTEISGAPPAPSQSASDPGTVNVLQQAKSGSLKVIAPELKGFYESFEEGNTLLRNQDTKFIFTIPNKTQLDSSNSKYAAKLNEFKSTDHIASQNANTNFIITYDPVPSDDISVERYNMSVRSEGNQASPIFTYASHANAPLIDSVRRIREGFANTTTFSPKTDFKKFVEDSYYDGTGIAKSINTLDYSSTFKDIFINAGKEVATSDFFNRDILSLVDFTPQLTLRQKECGCTDPHLLDLESIKKSVIKEFEESKCGKTIRSDDTTESASPLDAASIGGVISTIIRVYLTEFSLRSLFVLSKFPLESPDDKSKIIDSLIQSYFTSLIIDDLGKLDKKYSIDFQTQAVLYHNKIAKENDWTKTGDVKVALDNLVSQQLRSVISRMLQILGVNFSDSSLAKMFLENWLPLFDLPSQEGEARFFDATLTRENNAPSAVMKNISRSPLGGMSFDLGDGNIILERYISKVDKLEPTTPWDAGDVSLNQFKNILETDARYSDKTKALGTFFEDGISIGLRITYLPPLEISSTPPPSGNNIVTFQVAMVPRDFSVKQKAYELKESKRVITQRLTANQNAYKDLRRNIVTIPLTDSKLLLPELENLTIQQTLEQLDDIEAFWNRYSNQLVDRLIAKEEFQFLFDYCFPLKRMVFLLMTYSSTYFTFNKSVNNLFTNTKEQLKSTFYTMLNVNDPTYENETMKKIGGNKGLAALADNNEEIPGIDLLSLAAKTPLLILKGMAETADPNISIAKKIHDAALLGDVDIPMLVASLMALPMNIIPFPGGIGPPITPMGIAYLATDAAGALLSPKEKELRKKRIKEESAGKINLDEANNVDGCPKPEVLAQDTGTVPEPPVVEEPCEELCSGLADQVWLNIFATERRQYDRNLLKEFQTCAKIVVDGLYGPQTEAALKFYGPSNTPPKQYPRGGPFILPDCADKPVVPPQPCGEPCYDLAVEVHANILASERLLYNRELLRQFQTCAKIVVDGYYGPQTEAALNFYGPPNTPPKQYPTGGPFVRPDCEPSGPTES
jgi:hypothetical protein